MPLSWLQDKLLRLPHQQLRITAHPVQTHRLLQARPQALLPLGAVAELAAELPHIPCGRQPIPRPLPAANKFSA